MKGREFSNEARMRFIAALTGCIDWLDDDIGSFNHSISETSFPLAGNPIESMNDLNTFLNECIFSFWTDSTGDIRDRRGRKTGFRLVGDKIIDPHSHHGTDTGFRIDSEGRVLGGQELTPIRIHCHTGKEPASHANRNRAEKGGRHG